MLIRLLGGHVIVFLIMLNIHVESAKYASKIFWGKCFESAAPFMILNRKSLNDCQAACEERQNCIAVDYQRKMNICRLHDVLENLIHCAGHDVIFKVDFTMDTTDTCSGTCAIKDCNHIPNIVNAETFGNLLQIGDVLKVQCSHDGSVSYIECKPDGLWTQHPTCQTPVTSCGIPVAIPASSVTHSSLSIGSVAHYTCLPGFTASPAGAAMSITCLAGGQWESIGFICQQIDCGPPGNIANAQRTFSSTTIGSVSTFVCDSNYVVSPSGSSMDITCLNTGQWDSVDFTCQLTDCGTPPDVMNAQKTFPSTTFGSTVTYSCDSGYIASPVSSPLSFVCLNTGQWESISLICLQVNCGTPPDVTNAQKMFSSTIFGSVVTYSCNSGYSASPVSSPLSFACLNTGLWESVGLTCQQSNCGTPPDVSNAQKAFSSTTPGSIVTYSCDSGYSASPVSSPLSFVCLSTGQWESVGLTCQQVNCGTPPDVTNAQKTFPSTTSGSVVTYSCDSGYIVSPVSSPVSFVCLNTGQWESISLTCQQVNCGAPPDVTNAQKAFSSTTPGSIATYSCDTGYSASPVSSPLSFICLSTGQWESVGLTCQQVNCGTPPDVTNTQKAFSSTTSGSVVTYTCDSGYTVSPVSSPVSFVCLSTGQWESVSLACQQVDCGTPPDLFNGQSSYSSTSVGSVATYSCNSGFLVSPGGAETTVTCQVSGVWETVAFTCQASVQVGSSCSQDSDCVDPAAQCLYTGLWSKGSRCYCNPLYEFNQTLTVCIKVCDSYTSLERYDSQYIRKHNVGDSSGSTLNEAECLAFCANNYGDQYLSVDHRHAYHHGTNCYCGSVTRQQVLDSSPDLLYDDAEYTMFSRTCS